MPAIILGYNPLPPPPNDIGERLVRCRSLLGLSQKVFSGQLGVDQGTLAKMGTGRAGASRGVQCAGDAIPEYH